MATMKVTILTKICQKRQRNGSISFSCTGISSESVICRMNTFEDAQLKNLTPGDTVIIRGCRVFNRDNVAFLQMDADSKVRYIFH